MTARPVRILVVGDRFISSRLFTNALDAAATSAGLALAIDRLDLDYPARDVLPLPQATANGSYRPMWEDPDIVVSREAEDDAADATIREYSGPVDLLVPRLAHCDALVLHLAPVSRGAIVGAPHLRAIACARGGPTNINLERVNARGIPVFNCPGRNALAVAEYIPGAVLSLTRGIAAGSAATMAGRWRLDLYVYENTGSELYGQTCGLIGFGGVGRAFAPIARGFGMRLLVHDPYVHEDDIRQAGAEPVSLDDAVGSSDLIVLAARLTAETHGLIGTREFGLMRPSAIFVNAARAELVDGAALRAVLASRRIAGAVIDVFSPEPPLAHDPLLSMDNVLLTPHIAGATREAAQRGAETACRNLVAHLATGSLDGCLNRDKVETAHLRINAAGS